MRVGGTLVLLEPWMTMWSRFVYGRLHYEPFDMRADAWEFATSGPLSGANVALPWIVFERDRATFEAEYPEWAIRSVRLMMPLRYLLSGGVTMRSLMPGWGAGLWRGVEGALSPWMRHLAMFALIVVERVHSTDEATGTPSPRR